MLPLHQEKCNKVITNPISQVILQITSIKGTPSRPRAPKGQEKDGNPSRAKASHTKKEGVSKHCPFKE
jgi:hypothetical protein